MRRRALIAATMGTWGVSIAAPRFPFSRSAPSAEDEIAASVCSTERRASPRISVSLDRPLDLLFAGTRLFKEGFLDELGAAYGQSTGRRITILGGGCDDGLTAVRDKRAHIGGLCCPLEGGPAARFRSITVAQDLKVVVANPGVRVDNLGWNQLTSVLTGKTKNWKTVGGTDHSIALVLHDHCPDYVEPARKMLLGDRLSWAKDALYVKTDQKHLDTVARFDSAVGVNSWILAEPYVRSGKLKVLAVDGATPTIENAVAGRYKLVGPMNMVFSTYDEKLMQPFFSFLFSDSGRRIIGRRLVPVRADYSGARKPVTA